MVVPTLPGLSFGPRVRPLIAPPGPPPLVLGPQAAEVAARLLCEGELRFDGKAALHSHGVNFSNGTNFRVQLTDFEDFGFIGVGRYGKVRKVRHIPTDVYMALKEIRLDSSEQGLRQILMELSVLHDASSPYIVEFFGAFFVESSVYYCLELMDAGSLDRFIPLGGFPERVVGKVAHAVLQALWHMKRTLNVIHRDVRPSNILLDTRGVVKLCDFGVSGALKQSLSKTFVGCQKYMAPERITASAERPYGVQSDVWSLGVSLIEMSLGRFPYLTWDEKSLFNQSLMIINGPSPSLPDDAFSAEQRDFVHTCVEKEPLARKTLEELLQHAFVSRHAAADISDWARAQLTAVTPPPPADRI